MAAIKALEQWCRAQCDGYRDVAVTNMTTSFRDGLAFCALIHKFRPDLIDYDSLRKEDVLENNRLAFQVAEEKLGIPALLDAEDMLALRVPDRLSVLTYVSQYHNYFRGRPATGGVKRSAEGSKEEPSEKKNLPAVAKTFVSKAAAAEARLPSALKGHGSPRLARAAVQHQKPQEHANKHGTLSSRCVACSSHVHLVQRLFVDGNLYHRSCVKGDECCSVLHAGGNKPAKNPGAFGCATGQSGCKPSSSEAGMENGVRQTQPASRSSSVPSAQPSAVRMPVGPGPPSSCWTASAQRTQAARQRFFQAAPLVTGASLGNRGPTEPSGASGKTKVPPSPDEERSRSGTTLAEGNCSNNNNKHQFSIRSAATRFGDEPSSATTGRCRQGPAGTRAGRPSAGPRPEEASPGPKAVGKDRARPTTVRAAAGGPSCREWRPKLAPAKTQLQLKDESERRQAGLVSVPSSDVAASPPAAAAPTVPPGGSAALVPAQPSGVSPPKRLPASGDPGFNGVRPRPAKSPPGRPVGEESVGPSANTAADRTNPSGAKTGKYLSPTNTSRTEMRSPSVTSYHVPAEQIEEELSDIETKLAQLEKEGVELEKKLRSCEEDGDGDMLMDPLMVDWFILIRRKQAYVRKESELVYAARTRELERQQPGVEGELRRLLEKPDRLKSGEERQREARLMRRLVEIVDGRNAIVDVLDEDRLREVAEDRQLNQMMANLRVKKAKSRRKSSVSKLFRRGTKTRGVILETSLS